MKNIELKKKRRIRRKFSIRKRVFGTPERLRLTIFKSINHIYAQIINDVDGNTLVAASTLEKDIKEAISNKKAKVEQSKIVGKFIAEKALTKNIKKVSFDRNGYLYHGRVKALAESAREAGLEF